MVITFISHKAIAKRSFIQNVMTKIKMLPHLKHTAPTQLNDRKYADKYAQT